MRGQNLRVLQLEVPRELSFTLRPWRRDLFGALRHNGFDFSQADLNLPFWRQVLDDDTCDGLGRLLDLHHQGSEYNAQLLARLDRRARRLAVPGGSVGLRGFALDADIAQCSSSLLAWVESEATRAFWAPWLATLARQLDAADVVAFSVGSVDELALAAVVADHLRTTRPTVHACLAQHRWENFSLAPRMENLAGSGALLRLFDSAVLREDGAGAALSGLCVALRDGQLDALHNLAVNLDGQPRLLALRPGAPASASGPLDGSAEEEAIGAYLRSTGIPPDRLLLLEALVRNDCHYGKCTFCVQNIGYPQRQQYKHPPELDRSLGLVRHLATRHGVRAFSFIDQAVHPTLVSAVCDGLAAEPLSIQWCVRMLPDSAFGLPDSLLKRMAALGCSDILLGVESIEPDTLRTMAKCDTFDVEEAHRWIARCAGLGIDVTLSVIRGFPTEAEETFEAGTEAFLRACEEAHPNVAVVRNRFVLFESSQIAADPTRFGVASVTRQGTDLEFVLDYVDRHGRRPQEPAPPPDPAAVAMAHVHYSSIGLLHRWRTGRSLRSDLQGGQPGDPFDARRNLLVLGSNGYLGRSLARRLPAQRLLLSSRSATSGAGLDLPYVGEDLVLGHRRLAALSPREVWLCARPYTGDFGEHAAFLHQVQVLLDTWAERGAMRRLVVFSTQLVASTPLAGVRVNGASPLAPESAYDCAKAQLEVFAGYLARAHRISVDVVRLPLLWGGVPTPADEKRQLLHGWRNELRAGRRWPLQAGDESYGNSWVDVDDLVDALRDDPGPGLRTRSTRSGDFTYAQLQEAWGEGGLDGEPLELVRSRFLLEDELGLPQRGLPC